MDRQTRLLENLARRTDNGNGQGKMAAFMRLHPPTFDSAEEDPLSVDDWLHAITKKLNAVRATDEEKVNLATHQLVGNQPVNGGKIIKMQQMSQTLSHGKNLWRHFLNTTSLKEF